MTDLKGRSQKQKIHEYQGIEPFVMRISRKINDVLVQQLCQTTVIQFHNFNDTREVSFCPYFSYMLKSKSSVGLQQRKPIPECDTTCCSEDFSILMWLDAVCQQNLSL